MLKRLIRHLIHGATTGGRPLEGVRPAPQASPQLPQLAQPPPYTGAAITGGGGGGGGAVSAPATKADDIRNNAAFTVGNLRGDTSPRTDGLTSLLRTGRTAT